MRLPLLALFLAGRAGTACAAGLCVEILITSPTGRQGNQVVVMSSTLAADAAYVSVGATNCSGETLTDICAYCGPTVNCINVNAQGCASAWQESAPLCLLSPNTLTDGVNAWFDWQYIPASQGVVDFTVTVTGWDFATHTIEYTGTASARMYINGSLATQARVNPSVACQGNSFDVVVDMENTSKGALTSVVPSIVVSPPVSPSVAFSAGPSPSVIPRLEPGEIKAITWVYEAKLPGAVEFTVTLEGVDAACPGTTVLMDSTATVRIREPMSVTVFVSPTQASAGQLVQVLADAWNCGGMDLTGVTPCAPASCTGPECIAVTTMAGAAVVKQSEVFPSPCPVTMLPDAHAYFIWQYVAQTGGLVDFTVTMTGDKLGLGTTSDRDTGSLLIQNPPRLSATLYCSESGNVVPYQHDFRLYLHVFNLGETKAIYTLANIESISPSVPSATISIMECPPEAKPCPNSKIPSQQTADIQGVSATIFTWFCRATGPGALAISASSSAVDGNTNLPVLKSNVASLTITIPSPAILSMTVTGAAEAVQGQEIELKVRAMNTSTIRQISHATLAVEARIDGVVVPGGIVSAHTVLKEITDNLLPQLYSPQLAREFTLVVKLGDNIPARSLELLVSATGSEMITGVSVISYSAPLRMRIFAGKSKIGVISSNPYRQSSRTGVSVQYVVAPAQAGRPVSLKLYTVSGELVRVLVDGPQPPGVHEVRWDGKNSGGRPVASGLYLMVYKALASGDTRKLAVIK